MSSYITTFSHLSLTMCGFTVTACWVVAVSEFVFAIGYVSTWAVVGKIYASEIQPAKTRATTNSVATGGNFVSDAGKMICHLSPRVPD